MLRRLAVSLLAASLLAASADAASPKRASVDVDDNFFKPAKVTIRKDGKVTWRWRGSDMHNLALTKPGSGKVFKRSNVKTKGTFAHQFGKVGVWKMMCEIHPNSMKMKVVVKQQ